MRGLSLVLLKSLSKKYFLNGLNINEDETKDIKLNNLSKAPIRNLNN